jgi:hypothetical protein
MLLLVRQRPMNDCAIGSYISKVDERCRRDIQAKQASELVDGFVQDLIGAIE